VDLSAEDSGVLPQAKIPADGRTGPWLTAFRSAQALIMADGETQQFTAATDRVTGEVTKIEVTLTVAKPAATKP
jgi:hypothetical protein